MMTLSGLAGGILQISNQKEADAGKAFATGGLDKRQSIDALIIVSCLQ
jgi:hypothetical protein